MNEISVRYYTIAGVTFRVELPRARMYSEEGVLSAYRTEPARWDHLLQVEVTDRLAPPEGEEIFRSPEKTVYRSADVQIRYEGPADRDLNEGYLRICRRGNTSLVQIRRGSLPDHITPRLVLRAMEAEHQIVQRGGILLHASCVRWKDRAILFTAPSGTGKSTQAALWCRLRGAELINGDRISVFADGPAGPCARGIPFAGSSGVCQNAELKLAAIVFLSQAPVTGIAPLTGFRAFRKLWEGCSVNTWNRADVDACSANVMKLIQRVPVFHLACTPDETAVAALEQCLENEVT